MNTEAPDPKRWIALVILSSALFIIVLDNTIADVHTAFYFSNQADAATGGPPVENFVIRGNFFHSSGPTAVDLTGAPFSRLDVAQNVAQRLTGFQSRSNGTREKIASPTVMTSAAAKKISVIREVSFRNC